MKLNDDYRELVPSCDEEFVERWRAVDMENGTWEIVDDDWCICSCDSLDDAEEIVFSLNWTNHFCR